MAKAQPGGPSKGPIPENISREATPSSGPLGGRSSEPRPYFNEHGWVCYGNNYFTIDVDTDRRGNQVVILALGPCGITAKAETNDVIEASNGVSVSVRIQST